MAGRGSKPGETHHTELCRYCDNRAGGVPNYALRRAAAEYIQNVAMACSRHTDEIDLELDGDVDDRVQDVARSNHHLRGAG